MTCPRSYCSQLSSPITQAGSYSFFGLLSLYSLMFYLHHLKYVTKYVLNAIFLFITVTCSGSTLGMGKSFLSGIKQKGILQLHFRVTLKSGRQMLGCLLLVCMDRYAQWRKRGTEREIGIEIALTASSGVLRSDPTQAILGAPCRLLLLSQAAEKSTQCCVC